MPAALFCSGSNVVKKAGIHVNSTVSGADYTNEFIIQAEGYINAATRYNWNDKFATLNTDVKGILEDTAACYAAIGLINADMSGYTSRVEAEDMINVLWAKVKQNIEVLKDQKVVEFLEKA
jgi:hypothetical protein